MNVLALALGLLGSFFFVCIVMVATTTMRDRAMQRRERQEREARLRLEQWVLAQDVAAVIRRQHEAQEQTNRILTEASASTDDLLQQLVRMYERFFEVERALKKTEEQ